MKCNVCHNEFGNGEYCQSCETEKVVGLGNYTGYDVHGYDESSLGERTNNITSDSCMTICYKCTSAIPCVSEFCPACGIKLYTICPQCSHKFSSQYRFCSCCGKDINEYIAEQRRKKELEIAKQKEQEELRRIEELKRQEQLRLIAIAEQQPEYKEAFSYISEMRNQWEKKYKISNNLAVAILVIFNILATGLSFLLTWALADIALAVAVSLIVLFVTTLLSIIIDDGFNWQWKIQSRIMGKIWDSNEYIYTKHPIPNTITREIVIYVRNMPTPSDWRIKGTLRDEVLEAYFKVTQKGQ